MVYFYRIIYGITAIILIGLSTQPLYAKAKRQSHQRVTKASATITVGAFLGENPPTAAAISAFETTAQHALGSVSFYQGFGTTVADQPVFPAQALTSVIGDRSVQLTLEPWVPLQGITAGKYDGYLTKYASDIKTWNKPVYLRFAHEMIQDNHYDNCQGQAGCPEWYPWQDQPKRYVAAWRHVHDIFKQVDTPQVQFGWCPNSYPSDLKTIQQYYPGTQYVDWLCADGYNWTTTNNQPSQWFGDIFYNIYHTLADHPTIFGNKPISIGEMSSCDDATGTAKAAWITDAFQQLPINYPKITLFYWFNTNKECDWRINSSTASVTAFQQAMQAF